MLKALADNLGVPGNTLQRLGAGWSLRHKAYTFPVFDAKGHVIGVQYRKLSGKKWCAEGSKHGLFIPSDLPKAATLFITEGVSDCAAVLNLGLSAVGRFCCSSGVELLCTLVKLRRPGEVVIVADNDAPGQRGALALSDALATLAPSVKVIAPPKAHKDVRVWVNGGATVKDILQMVSSAKPVEQAGPVLVSLADVKPEPVRWLWSGWIPLGKFTIIAGDPGLGKSFLTLDLAARVSRGDGWPDEPTEKSPPGGVVLLSAEDDVADTIRPRLDSAGAAVNRVNCLSAIKRRDGTGGAFVESPFSLERDLPALEQAISRTRDCRLVVIDPITAYMGKTDSHVNAEVRGLLAPLSKLAAKYGVAIVGVSHLNKNTAGRAMYRTMGSLAFVAAARSAALVVRDKDKPARRLMLPIKNNLSVERSGLAFEIVGGRLLWDRNPVPISADDALAIPDLAERGCRAISNDTIEWLKSVLSGGPLPATEIRRQAMDAGIAWRTVERVKSEAGVHVRCTGAPGKQGRWVWILSKGMTVEPPRPPTIPNPKPWRPLAVLKKTLEKQAKPDPNTTPPPLRPPTVVCKGRGGVTTGKVVGCETQENRVQTPTRPARLRRIND
ncbi:MAG: AAA family ATPase [Tepidisphaeraceae bacterium]